MQQSYTDFMSRQYRYNVLQVLWLTGLTETAFFSLVFEKSMEWVEMQANGHSAAEMLYNEQIWKWWLLEWYKRDNVQFLKSLYYLPADVRLASYKQMHNQVFIRCSHNYNLLEGSYAAAVGDMIDHLSK